jgi:hypothetical protein
MSIMEIVILHVQRKCTLIKVSAKVVLILVIIVATHSLAQPVLIVPICWLQTLSVLKVQLVQ